SAFVAGLVSHRVPFSRTRYFLAEGVRWGSSFQQYFFGPPGSECEGGCFDQMQHSFWERPDYEPGGTYRESWFGGVFGPRFLRPDELSPFGLVRYGAVRRQDRFAAALTLVTDSTPGHMHDARSPRSTATLYRNGELFQSFPGTAFLRADLPPEEAVYRLDAVAQMPTSEVSTEVSTSWTFRSGHVDGTEARALPLMTVRYTPVLDRHNRAPAGPGFRVPVAVERQPGAPGAEVVRLTVEVSDDDGKTWRTVPVRRDGAGWSAEVDNVRGRPVSLRATAVDADGGGVRQTVIRAYRVVG
ncbi:hypothetical protein AB0M28_26670, partial [Streptomyces sp. NPDC051940]